MSQSIDELYMEQALALAASQLGRTSPDPLVGAVIVKNGKVISTGYHAEQSTLHAEAMAIAKAGIKAKGATLYLNLEPCCHYGYNPPCTNAIIKAGIKRVVAAIKDPNPLVAGKGFKQLIEAGIKVDIGLLKDEAKKLNDPFIKHIRTGVPFVMLKSAMSLDGKIATVTGESMYITGKESRQYVHVLRTYVDAILTTINTIKIDDPQLTVRDVGNAKIKKRDPIRVVLDPLAEIPLNSKILNNDPEKTIIVVSEGASDKKVEKIQKKGAIVIDIPSKDGNIDLKKLLKELGRENIMAVMIEAGGGFASAALSSGIVDKVAYFIAPKIVGGKDALTPVEGHGIEKLNGIIHLKNVTYTRLGEDVLVEGYV
jgi:diaminohydroxyphosphoribosylaminopyrimidine deaminase / 5-amino-6-(5-phosphoribosylamino)uracil reductase